MESDGMRLEVDVISQGFSNNKFNKHRIKNFTKYQKIKNEYTRILKIIIDNGPICLCQIASFAKLPLDKTKEIVEYLMSDEVNSVGVIENSLGEGGSYVKTYYCY
jgi:hypothetical protein